MKLADVPTDTGVIDGYQVTGLTCPVCGCQVVHSNGGNTRVDRASSTFKCVHPACSRKFLLEVRITPVVTP